MAYGFRMPLKGDDGICDDAGLQQTLALRDVMPA